MKCWKCGKENAEGAAECLYCQTSLDRVVPTTEIGKAMRQIYDEYGSETVLKNGSYLVNGIRDLVGEDCTKFRNRLKMAMDCRIGDLYQAQLEAPQPRKDFEIKVRIILTEDVGLNEKFTAEIMQAFDEMIGWPLPKKASASSSDKKQESNTANTEKQKPSAAQKPKSNTEKQKPSAAQKPKSSAKRKTQDPFMLPPVNEKPKLMMHSVVISTVLIVGIVVLNVFMSGLIPYLFYTIFALWALYYQLTFLKVQFRWSGNILDVSWTCRAAIADPIWYLKVGNQFVYIGKEAKCTLLHDVTVNGFVASLYVRKDGTLYAVGQIAKHAAWFKKQGAAK